jgi:hypothetical protein
MGKQLLFGTLRQAPKDFQADDRAKKRWQSDRVGMSFLRARSLGLRRLWCKIVRQF